MPIAAWAKLTTPDARYVRTMPSASAAITAPAPVPSSRYCRCELTGSRSSLLHQRGHVDPVGDRHDGVALALHQDLLGRADRGQVGQLLAVARVGVAREARVVLLLTEVL